jgi:hypothetical protein
LTDVFNFLKTKELKMALVNQDDHYVRIVGVNIESCDISIEYYKSIAVRNNPTKFDASLRSSVNCATLTGLLITTTGACAKDAILTAGYLALKNEPPFNNSGVDQWTDC